MYVISFSRKLLLDSLPDWLRGVSKKYQVALNLFDGQSWWYDDDSG